METVQTLTKDDCLDADKQLTAKRGMPQNIFSDNSKSFIGTRRKVEFQKLLMDRELKELLEVFTTGHNIKRLTIPLRFLLFGGLWEAAIRSM